MCALINFVKLESLKIGCLNREKKTLRGKHLSMKLKRDFV